MIEADLKTRWERDRPSHEAWGNCIMEEVCNQLSDNGKNLNIFLKVPAATRLKTTESLIDKALYRGNDYNDPYDEIEDKVGVRFVVLLLKDIELICSIIEASNIWQFDACKHFDDDKEKEPLLFTYQSVHYVLRPREPFQYSGQTISEEVACEVQIRTLLQHAHAELTHDAIYKSKKDIKPNVLRTVAKSMALIETTDEFFVRATEELNSGPLTEHAIIERLDGLYRGFTEISPHTQKSTLIIWDEFEGQITEDLIENIQSQLVNDSKYDFLSEKIKDRYADHVLYQQSVVLFLYWMLIFKKRRLLQDWPFSNQVLENLANDVGVSISTS